MEDLVREAARRYDFRPRHRNETETEYRGALIRHVANRDHAAAHELRLGKRQAEWTSADAQSFREHLQRLPRSAHDPDDHLITFPVLTDHERTAVSDDNLLVLAHRALTFCVDFRTEAPVKDFQPMVTVLLMTGEVLHAMPGRDDRIRAIKLLCRQYPVYGYIVAADVFIHGLMRHPITNVETATKQDAFVVHVGTRTLRRILLRDYRVVNGRAIFEPLREPLNDKELVGMEDPYADVFVTIPTPAGKPS